jgi:hypothetical protein
MKFILQAVVLVGFLMPLRDITNFKKLQLFIEFNSICLNNLKSVDHRK